MTLSPMPTLGELLTYYPPDYHGYNASQRGVISLLYHLVYLSRFREYKNLIGTRGRIIDVGCADAPYFDLLKKKYPDLELTGVEFNDEIAERGRKKGRNIITGTMQDINASESFDLVIMNNLIEHVIDPIEELRKAHHILKPGGFILLETPNTDSWDYSLFQKYWGSLHIPRHLYLFSPASIEILAGNVGFEVIGTKHLLSTDNWALSIQNYLQTKKMFRCTRRNGRVWYYKYLLLAFIPFCMLQVMFKKTGAFVSTLRKLP
jgi:SAM-dependent methyltransferase